jgi:hypothetical protein
MYSCYIYYPVADHRSWIFGSTNTYLIMAEDCHRISPTNDGNAVRRRYQFSYDVSFILVFPYWLHLLDHVAVTVYGNYILLPGMTKFQLSLINTPFGKIRRDGQEESSLEDYKYPVKYLKLEMREDKQLHINLYAIQFQSTLSWDLLLSLTAYTYFLLFSHWL